MRATKAKSLRRQAQALSIGQPNKFLLGARRGKNHNLYLEHAHSCTRSVYQKLKASARPSARPSACSL